tara:strand:+ start:72 stop:326 length:255 start_codon:yes stop_codon:yes gene_type:complete
MFAVALAVSWQPSSCGVTSARPCLAQRTSPVLALLDGQKPILPTEFTQAIPDVEPTRPTHARTVLRLPLSLPPCGTGTSTLPNA